MHTLNVFSEDDISIGAECPQCGRVLKIRKENMIKTVDGFLLRPSVICPCKQTYTTIVNARGNVSDKRELPNNRNELKEITSPEMLTIGSMVRRYSDPSFSRGPGWLGGWLKVLDIDFERKLIYTSEYDNGTKDDCGFGDMFYGYNGCTHVHCYCLPESSGSSIKSVKPSTKPQVNPSSLTASELIDYMKEHRSDDDILSLGSKLTAKLMDDFYSHPEVVEKAIRTFGDAGMVSRFNLIRSTMKPNDLELLVPDILRDYIKLYHV